MTDPEQVRRLSASSFEHLRIDVETGHTNAAPGQLPANSPGPTTGIENEAGT